MSAAGRERGQGSARGPLWLAFLRTWAGQVAASAPRSAWLGAVALAAVALAGVLSPLSGYPVGADVDPLARSLPPSGEHWLGTDHLGRDVFWRLLLSSSAFVGPGLLSCATTLLLALPLGALAGWVGGSTSQLVTTLLGSVAAVPRLVLVLLCCTIFGNDPVTLALSAGLGAAPSLAAAVRERIERLKLEEFVLASSAHGLSPWRILLLHLLAIASGRAIARQLCEAFGAFMVLECTLSYLGGFGVQEPVPSWGNMLAFEWGRELSMGALAPGLCIWGTLLAAALAARLFSEVEDG